MSEAQPAVAEIAALVGNPARANILMALIEGRALTASELSYVAGVSPQTTSEHLAMLREANLLSMTKQGRHCYFRLGSPQVARMIESIMVVAVDAPQRYRPRWNGGEQLRTARTCYDHIAGRLGVALTEALTRQENIVLSDDGGMVTRAGEKFLADFGVHLEDVKRGRRTFCRPCVDWSERRLHLAGALGAALAGRCLELGWIARIRNSRALKISARRRERLSRAVRHCACRGGIPAASSHRLSRYAARSRCEISTTRAREASASISASAFTLLAASRLASHSSSR
jgi:DNA-binding transcriptional ArsR family regulator